MFISRKWSPYKPITSLTVDNLLIEQVQSYRNLSVWLTSTLTWSVQVESVCQRARQQIGIIYRKFYGHSNRSTLLQLYLAYVRPHLEYAVPVWDPHQQGHINSLEKVQKFALKVCTGKWNVDHENLLNSCKLPTLVSRRQYLKLSFLYQVIHGSFILFLMHHLRDVTFLQTWEVHPLFYSKDQEPTQMPTSTPFFLMWLYCGTIYLPLYTTQTLCSLLNITIIICIGSLSLIYCLVLQICRSKGYMYLC